MEPLFRFHVEHIIPRQHGGSDQPGNVALACGHCNRHKGPNLTATDPETCAVERLFDPRRQEWNKHFGMAAGVVAGLSPVGRATVNLLRMNLPRRIVLRAG